jgi:hypothetical protein
VFDKSATRLVGQAISNGQIHASNEYLETFTGQQMNMFRNGSDTYLAEEQYAMVKHVGLNFISYLPCFYCTFKYVQVSIAWFMDRPGAY